MRARKKLSTFRGKTVSSYKEFFKAVEKGDFETVMGYINHPVITTGILEWKTTHALDLNHANGYGETALFIAADYGHTSIVQALLNAGANVNQADKSGRTPLHAAAKEGHRDIVQA